MDIEQLCNTIYKNLPLSLSEGDSIKMVKTIGGVDEVVVDVTIGPGKVFDGNINIRGEVRAIL